MHRITVNLTPDEYARFEEMLPEGVSESSFFRALLRESGHLLEDPTHDEALRLLAESARSGKVAARIALERAMRPLEKAAAPEGELARLLSGNG